MIPGILLTLYGLMILMYALSLAVAPLSHAAVAELSAFFTALAGTFVLYIMWWLYEILSTFQDYVRYCKLGLALKGS